MPVSPLGPSVPRAFLIVVFAIAIAVGTLVAYLGMTGVIGAGIP